MTEFDCEYGVMVDISPTVRRIVAQNPGPFTFKGTGTYVVGRGKVAARARRREAVVYKRRAVLEVRRA